MPGLGTLLRHNPNYRNIWLGQVVSEVGDYFNAVAVLALIMQQSGSGFVVSMVFLSRAIPSVLAAPFAGVLLDRMDRRHIMIASDLVRAVLALLFIFTVNESRTWMFYVLSALLSFASPFFTAGRSAILPSIASPDELHAANAVTQTTGWATLTVGAILGGWASHWLGYSGAFVFNSVSFVFSAWCIWRVTATTRAAAPKKRQGGRHDYMDGLRYIRSVPLFMGIGMISVGWAVGGGAAQILFALFGDKVFHRGAAGIGDLWGFAGVGLLIGGAIAHALGEKMTFAAYKRTVALAYIAHGAGYMLFSQAPTFWLALALITLSRVGMAAATVLNSSQLLRHTSNEYLGRTFATMESLRNTVMIFSVSAAGIAADHFGPRTIGLIAGGCGLLTAIAWALADVSGKLPEPRDTRPTEEAA